MLSANLPVLPIIAPLIAGPVCLLLMHPLWTWRVAVVVSAFCLATSAMLLAQVLGGPPISYLLGGWAAPWGIEYRIDTVNAFVLLIVSGISTVALVAARLSVEHEVEPHRIPVLYAAWMLNLAGLLGIAATGDAFNVFVFLEISALSTYLLVSLSRDRRGLTAAFRYLVLGTIGATFILIGIAFLYVMTGTLNMQDLSMRIPQVRDTRTVHMAFTFLIVGIAIKAAVFPMHLWLPNAYAYAPSPVTALLAGTATKVSIYLLLRFFFTIFGIDFSVQTMGLDSVLLPLALAAMFVMSGIAIFQVDVKRMLACSSVAQIGYMVLGIALMSVTGLTATILHLFNHAVMKAALFLALAAVIYRIGSCARQDMAGLGRAMPWTMAAFVIGGLSLVGVPLTVGFISKWYLILAAIELGWWWLAVLVLVSSLLALIYIWRVVEVAYFQPRGPNLPSVREAPLGILLPTWVLILANFYFGIDTSLTVNVARTAAMTLMGGTQ